MLWAGPASRWPCRPPSPSGEPIGVQQPEDRAIVKLAVVFEDAIPQITLPREAEAFGQPHGPEVLGRGPDLNAVQGHRLEREPQHGPNGFGGVALSPAILRQAAYQKYAPQLVATPEARAERFRRWGKA